MDVLLTSNSDELPYDPSEFTTLVPGCQDSRLFGGCVWKIFLPAFVAVVVNVFRKLRGATEHTERTLA